MCSAGRERQWSSLDRSRACVPCPRRTHGRLNRGPAHESRGDALLRSAVRRPAAVDGESAPADERTAASSIGDNGDSGTDDLAVEIINLVILHLIEGESLGVKLHRRLGGVDDGARVEAASVQL